MKAKIAIGLIVLCLLVVVTLVLAGCSSANVVGSYMGDKTTSLSLRLNSDKTAVSKDADSGKTFHGTYSVKNGVVLIMWSDGTVPDEYKIVGSNLSQQIGKSSYLYRRISE